MINLCGELSQQGLHFVTTTKYTKIKAIKYFSYVNLDNLHRKHQKKVMAARCYFDLTGLHIMKDETILLPRVCLSNLQFPSGTV